MIAILFVGAFVSFVNETFLNVALPSIMKDFEISPSSAQWLSTGYMLINGILIPASAFLLQKFTNRQLYITAMGLFTAGTVLASLSPTFGVLLVARMFQAAGSAIMAPLLMNVMLVAFPVERRGTAMGFFGLVMITAPAIGPTLSGWIVEHYSWRTLFDIVIPIAALTLILAIFKLKNILPQKQISLDILSLILSSIGFGGILYGFSSAGEKGWDSVHVYGTIIVGTISLVLFIVRQLKMEEPLLQFRIYKYPMFALSSAISIVLSMTMFSAMLLMPIYIQTIRGISPFDSGLLMLPGAIIMGIMSPITGRLFDKFGARALAIIGLSITIFTTYEFSHLAMDTSYSFLMLMYSLRMFGMSMVMMPVMANGINQLPQTMNPHATAMNNTLQQVSGAAGSALLVTLMQNKTETEAERLAQAAAGDPAKMADIMNEAMLNGINFSFKISLLIALIALVLTFFIKRAKPEGETYLKQSAS
ncbi:DHA2 family efflux MFS transporter permease subunit [Aeribacillus pallidus]|uniref:DHA2 family efflux MFS transporter permease subunit n=1 Tax=Aeribacillus TaxID=1055323 RepID=UPI0007B47291|nr:MULTISPECIES: DHA2 family efflux MFS transporter permease subunit [Aeribacillus]KZM54602.1 MFS transporter [Aeribacillus pallidus]MED0651341.1 DHA2 family efflux MFS transporter permease subunit [Aeribacillus composti]MED4487329.1 DHA2 family efflux MFS transporter permease subunit [Aeribacillus pallidus]